MRKGSSQSSQAQPARLASASDATRGQRAHPGAAGPAPVHLSDIYRGWPKLGLIRDLAFGEFSHAQIAQDLGCKTSDVAEFASQHEDEILEVRSALAGKLAIETAGLWIAKRQNRLAEYQADVEDLNQYIAELRERGALGTVPHREALKSKVVMLKAVADELTPRGALAVRAAKGEDDKNVVRYVIEDPDIEEMQ